MGRTAILYIAERCNQSCVFCLEEDGSWNEFVDPSTQQVLDTLTRLRARGADHITFMGGETFFRKDLARILAEAKRGGYTRIGVTTNGTVLSKPGFVRDLVDAGLDFIELSIHGHTPELANAIGGTHFTFERQAAAMREIDALRSLPVIVNVVICRENKDHLADVAEYVRTSFPNITARFKFKFASLVGLALERARAGDLVSHADVDWARLGDRLEKLGVPFWFYNVPLCVLGSHAAHSHELVTLSCGESYFDFDHRGEAEYYDSGDQLEGRVCPADPCESCTVRPLCPGIEETYRESVGAGSLRARSDDPLPLMEMALRERRMDTSLAPARLVELRARPRPSTFRRRRPEGAIRFERAGSDPLDLQIEPRKEGEHSFVSTRRFALSYRRWGAEDPAARPDVRELVEAAGKALEEADTAGLSLGTVRHEIAKTARAGWSAAVVADAPVPRKKRVPLPLLGPNGELG